jgi:endoglucanase
MTTAVFRLATGCLLALGLGCGGMGTSRAGGGGAAGTVVTTGAAGGPASSSGTAGTTSTGAGGSQSGAAGESSASDAGPTTDAAPSPTDAAAIDSTPPTDAPTPAGSVVAMNGTLHTMGSHIVGSSGTPVQLKGMSLYWSQYAAGKPFFNAAVIHWLVTDWHISIIRVAIGVTGANDGDYLSDPAGQLKLLDNVVQAAFADGIYVIIDWHDHEAAQHVASAKTFFDTVSARYGDHPNVIYEIWNEPKGNEGLTWDKDLKPNAQTISKVIRQHDTKNLMVVGTPFWDQQPNVAVGDAVDDPNVAYTLHFYAGASAHKLSGDIGKSAKAALAGGVPLFVTEWGTVDPVDQSIFNEAESRTWMTFLDQNAISSCNWAISGANEGSSALEPGASPTGGWKDSDLSPSGLFVRSLIRGF